MRRRQVELGSAEYGRALEHLVALEVKASERVTDRDLRGLRALGEEALVGRRIVASFERQLRRTADGIEVWPVEEFLRALWAGEVVK